MEQILSIIDRTDKQLFTLEKSWFDFYWTRFSLLMIYCYEKLTGQENKMNSLYRLSANMKKDANPIIYYDECTICLELIVEIYGHESRACRKTCNHVFHL